MRALLLALALVAAPAQAQVYGPPAPENILPEPRADEVYTPAQIAEADAKWKADSRAAWTKFWISQGLVAADIGLTCAILARGGRERNPIYGKNASCGRIAAIRGVASIAQYFLVRRAIRDDPAKSRKTMNLLIVIQGIPAFVNAVQLAK